ncbi:MAG: hypothetical protein RMK74_17045, partial [Myxococcales bacterium]|nr:hypothetical protein [Myxococcales bacterium]
MMLQSICLAVVVFIAASGGCVRETVPFCEAHPRHPSCLDAGLDGAVEGGVDGGVDGREGGGGEGAVEG